jgi:glutamate-1-semialdehyde 2,1-aminomutase
MSIIDRYVELHPASHRLAQRATRVFPDGVTHDVRFDAPFSLYVKRASGSRKVDADGNELVDYVMGHGALLLGHSYPAVTDAVREALGGGTHLGASHEAEIRWGELVQQLVPSAERVRFTSSGTEATMMALRLSRAFTGREKILRLREHFHGWNDSVTGQPGPEETIPRSHGLPRGILDASIVIPQNDIAALERTLDEDGRDIAAMIFEPTGAHFGVEPIAMDFVRAAREQTSKHDVLLIFDEVITGFRVSPGGAQQAYGIKPDLTTMAKIVAGGLPGGCVAGRAEIVDQIRMEGSASGERIAHQGTFNANPLSATAGAVCLTTISDGGHQARATETARMLARAMNGVLREAGVAGCVYGYSSMLHIVVGAGEPPPDGYSWGECPPTDTPVMAGEASHALQLAMINEGVHLMATGMMVSSVHDASDVDRTVEAFRASIAELKAGGLLK